MSSNGQRRQSSRTRGKRPIRYDDGADEDEIEEVTRKPKKIRITPEEAPAAEERTAADALLFLQRNGGPGVYMIKSRWCSPQAEIHKPRFGLVGCEKRFDRECSCPPANNAPQRETLPPRGGNCGKQRRSDYADYTTLPSDLTASDKELVEKFGDEAFIRRYRRVMSREEKSLCRKLGPKKFLGARKNHMSTYGMEISAKIERLAAQDGFCANLHCRKRLQACVKTVKERHATARVDHCEACGRVGGLLCNGCNIADGYFAGNPDLMESVADRLDPKGNSNLWNRECHWPGTTGIRKTSAGKWLPKGEYSKRLAIQENMCHSCLIPISLRLPKNHPGRAEAHHVRNTIIALLCRNCNSGFGNVGDSLNKLRGLAKYARGKCRGGHWGFPLANGCYLDSKGRRNDVAHDAKVAAEGDGGGGSGSEDGGEGHTDDS